MTLNFYQHLNLLRKRERERERERENESTFDNQNVILEKYLTHPKHIKMQIMAYMHGNVGYLHKWKLMAEMTINASQAVG